MAKEIINPVVTQIELGDEAALELVRRQGDTLNETFARHETARQAGDPALRAA